MAVMIEIPDQLAAAFTTNGGDITRTALEAMAIEGYRSDRLSEYEVQQLLGFESRLDVHGFLKQHGVYLHYGLEDLEQDIRESDRHIALRAAEARTGQHAG